MARFPLPPTAPPGPTPLATRLRAFCARITGPLRNSSDALLTTLLVGVGLHTAWMSVSTVLNDYLSDTTIAAITGDERKSVLLIDALPECVDGLPVSCLASPPGITVMSRAQTLVSTLARRPDNPAVNLPDTRRAYAYAAAQAIGLVDEASECTSAIARQLRRNAAAVLTGDASRPRAVATGRPIELAVAVPGLEPETVRTCAFAWSVIWQVAASAGPPGRNPPSDLDVLRHVGIGYALLRANLALLPRDDGVFKMTALALAIDSPQAFRDRACMVSTSDACIDMTRALQSPDGSAAEIAPKLSAGPEPATIYAQQTKAQYLDHSRRAVAILFVLLGTYFSKLILFGLNKWITGSSGGVPP